MVTENRIVIALCWGHKVSVAQSYPTLCDFMDCSPPGSSIHGILQARILEWVAIPFSRESSQPKSRSSALQANSLLSEPPGNLDAGERSQRDTWKLWGDEYVHCLDCGDGLGCIYVKTSHIMLSIYVIVICQLYYNKAILLKQ